MNPLEQLRSPNAQITYFLAADLAGNPGPLGEFPHAAMWTLIHGARQCEASIDVTDASGTERCPCTRERGHTSELHVNHHQPGLPTIAWRETRVRITSRAGSAFGL